MLKNTFLDNKTNTMTLKRMGSRYPSRLSFARSMIRTMLREKWKIKRVKFNLDNNGYGCAIYEVLIKKKIYSLVCFSQYLEDKERSDRVIAEKWDTAYTLYNGKVSAKEINRLKRNIPRQESGRSSSKELVLSRANKSVRLFEKVVDLLSRGKQPKIKDINNVGYLLRTTAVYGSGKFGLSDFILTKTITNFNQPFRAEMLAVYIIREFSIDLIEHIAYHRNSKKAVKLEKKIKQHLGIGNSTGLGMAPFIIKHPKLIHQWIYQFEFALKKIKKIKNIELKKFNKFISLLNKAKIYLKEVVTTDELQKKKNNQAYKEIDIVINYCKKINLKKNNWKDIISYTEKNTFFDVHEIVKVQMIEVFPKIADPLAENMSLSDDFSIKTNSTVKKLKKIIEKNYQWAINTDYKNKDNTYLFWYVSEEKLEPRLGERYNEPGSNLEQPLGIGKIVNEFYSFLCNLDKKTLSLQIVEFLLLYPEYRGIIKRIHTLSDFEYGEVKDNILAKNVLAIDMLRFKLSFFGASRYDPKSDRWLRVSFFTGAPYFKDLNNMNSENWGFANMESYN
tara:strand:- start:5679 stop:7361 length:1683 start_codon:yes stop_codon:yes gene_type:complete